MDAKTVYLDNAGTTSPDPAVIRAMVEVMEQYWGNPSSIYEVGRKARMRIEEARRQVAGLFDCRPEEIVFTSGGTESDNLAILGTLERNRRQKKHIITAAIEHSAVLDTVKWCRKNGFEVSILPVGADGLLDPSDVKKVIRKSTAIISVMFVNNEIGTIQNIAEISNIAQEAGVVFHTDAVQAFGVIPFKISDLNADLVSVSSHKIYGPKGVGVLYVKQGTRLSSLTHGGSQERGLRTGTENVQSIVGFGKACELCREQMGKTSPRIQALREELERRILEEIEGVNINGSLQNRAPGILNCSFKGCEGEALLVGLDMRGIYVSTGSACSAGSVGASHVLLALGLSKELIGGSLRFSFGRNNQPEDVEAVMEFLPGLVRRLRQMSPVMS